MTSLVADGVGLLDRLSALAHVDSASSFYLCSSILMWTVWLVFSVLSRSDWHQRGLKVPVLTRPTWAPPWLATTLRRRTLYLTVCHGVPWVLLLASWLGPAAAGRVAVAVAVSLYGWTEAAVTHSHRDFAMVYTAWALALLPLPMAKGVAHGICIHFIASSGFAKLLVGGVSSWAAPETMRSILRHYGRFNLADAGPLSPMLNRFVCEHDSIASAIAAATLVFECVLVPLSLFLPCGGPRFAVALASVGLHIGIATVQSGVVGLAFLPNLATYLLGFNNDLEVGSDGWWLSLVVTAVSAFAVIGRGWRLLPENWPLTPFALFAWSSFQWNLLFTHFVRRRTRLALAVSSTALAAGKAGLIGASVVSAYDQEAQPVRRSEKKGLVLFDGWEQCIGETLVFQEVLDCIDFEAMASVQGGTFTDACGAVQLVTQVEWWLEQQKRLLVAETGEVLTKAFWVMLDPIEDVVVEVLAVADTPYSPSGDRRRAAKPRKK